MKKMYEVMHLTKISNFGISDSTAGVNMENLNLGNIPSPTPMEVEYASLPEEEAPRTPTNKALVGTSEETKPGYSPVRNLLKRFNSECGKQE